VLLRLGEVLFCKQSKREAEPSAVNHSEGNVKQSVAMFCESYLRCGVVMQWHSYVSCVYAVLNSAAVKPCYARQSSGKAM
jgi:hypothetical protein